MSPMSTPPDVEGAPSVHDQRRSDESDSHSSVKTPESNEYPSEMLLSPSRIFRSARALDHCEVGRHTPDPFEDKDKDDRKQSPSTTKRDGRHRHRGGQRHTTTSFQAGTSTSSKARRGHRQSKVNMELKRTPENRDHEDTKKLNRKIQEIRQFLVQAEMTRSAESRALMQELATAKEQLEETQRLAHWKDPATGFP